MIHWHATLEIGHAAFDEEHRQLVTLVNLLEGAVLARRREMADILAPQVQALVEIHAAQDKKFLLTIGGDEQSAAVEELYGRMTWVAGAMAGAGDARRDVGQLLWLMQQALIEAVALEKAVLRSADLQVRLS